MEDVLWILIISKKSDTLIKSVRAEFYVEAYKGEYRSTSNSSTDLRSNVY